MRLFDEPFFSGMKPGFSQVVTNEIVNVVEEK
jgi:hypothetical protein